MRFNRKFLIIGSLVIAAACTGCAGEKTSDEKSPEYSDEGTELENLTVYTSVRSTGQYPESFVLTYNKSIEGAPLSPDVFHLEGNASYWESNGSKRSFSSDFKSAEVKDNTLTIVPDEFPEKYFYVEDFVVDCASDRGKVT